MQNYNSSMSTKKKQTSIMHKWDNRLCWCCIEKHTSPVPTKCLKTTVYASTMDSRK
jgi:hypothetical protein